MTRSALRERRARRSAAGARSGRRAPRRLRDGRTQRRPLRLDDRYRLESGRVLLTGVQALVRLPLDQHRADRRAGLRTATMVSGYQGSPLGGLDRELERNAEICREHQVVHVPGLNEELGATSAWGSQLAARMPDARYDGVLALWYGKAPGLDRAADSLRHGNFVGVSRTGGALAVVGDDPSCKSSTIPSASEAVLASLHMPTFFPGSVQEVLDLGLHAFACSRASGLWCGFKIVTEVADAIATAALAPTRVVPRLPELGYEHVPDARLLAPASLTMERSLLGPRTELALAYARLNGVNRIEGARRARLGVVAAGKSWFDLRQALRELGLDEAALERAGVRLLKLGMIWPLERDIARDFAHGLDEVLVVEEKRPFIEPALKDALYGMPGAPRIVGKRDEEGRPLLPAEGDLDADAVARVVAARLRASGVVLESVEARMRALDAVAARPAELPLAARAPFFCSGCPHNSSLAAPEGTLVGGGIGCHTMVLLSPEGHGELTGITQMGGEGAQWIGIAPFVEREHLVQNLGDGTFHHSGSLAIRAAVATNANITYKLLYNEAVAMTGGQRVQGALTVPALTRWLEIEGVRRVIVTTDDPKRYRGAELAGIAEVRHRRDLLAAQEELAQVAGVTALIHDQGCAAEKRRMRKRGKLPEPAARVWINERVCEGCGDCGRKSGCLSVVPVETELGRKTQIHQASCNLDFSCLEGDCPSFVTVTPRSRPRRVAPDPPGGLPEPRRVVPAAAASVRMTGIGGTGVVTMNQLLGTAALIEGMHVVGLDQTGLSQKAGPVVSDLHVSRTPLELSGKATAAGVDLLLGFDLLGAASPGNLATAEPGRTVAVVSTSAVPTGRMVLKVDERFPELDGPLEAIDRVTRRELGVRVDAQALSERLFGDHMPANTILLGAAFQRGALPVSAEALEEAIRLNGAAVETNLRAFAWGRAVVAAPAAVEAAMRPTDAAERPDPSPRERALIDRAAPAAGELRRIVELRVPELVAYGGAGYARRYSEAVERARVTEEERVPGRTGLAEAVARQLFKLMAYKDEYEVARLHLDAVERARREGEFGADARVRYHLHPPLLRALGLRRKLALGLWFTPAFEALHRMRRLRGTPLDPFGHTEVRRTERALVAEYERLVDEALSALAPDTHALAVELAELPDVVRGYEELKLRNVALFRRRAESVRRRLARAAAGEPAGV